MNKTIYMSKNTDTMLKALKETAIIKYAEKYMINPDLIRAICKKESGDNAFACRIEPHLKRAKWYKRTLLDLQDIQDYHFCSFGYMQIMFGTARHIGYLGNPFDLFNPDKAIKFGTKFFKQCVRRYKNNVHHAIAAYNQGNNRYYDINKNGIKDANEKYRNQDYVDKVLKYYTQFRTKG